VALWVLAAMLPSAVYIKETIMTTTTTETPVQDERFAFHPLATQLTDITGYTLQTVQMSKDEKLNPRKLSSMRIRVRSLSVSDALAFPAIAAALDEEVYSMLRQYVLKPRWMNGESSVAAEDCSLAALNAALLAGGVSRLTKDLLVSLFDTVLTPAIAALVCEAKKLSETCTNEEILLIAGPTIKAMRGAFLSLSQKDAVLDAAMADRMKKVVAFAAAAGTLPDSGAGTADNFAALIDARASDVVEF
jgi:hypothetical protein